MPVSLTLPTVGGDFNAWGGILNTALGVLETAVNTAQATADAATALVENVHTVATSGAAQTLPDVTTATIHQITLTANCTITVPTPGAGKSLTVILVQDATGGWTVTWATPSGTIHWSGGVAPTQTAAASKTDVYSLVCADGTNWIGLLAGQNF